MRSRFIGVVVATLMVAAACSGTNANETNDSADANETASSSTAPAADTDPVDTQEGDSSGVTATVTIGSDVTEIGGDLACLTDGSVAITVADGTDQISINYFDDVILIRMTINGAEFADVGSPPVPVVVGEGENAVVTWSGSMSSDGVSQPVSIEVRC